MASASMGLSSIKASSAASTVSGIDYIFGHNGLVGREWSNFFNHFRQFLNGFSFFSFFYRFTTGATKTVSMKDMIWPMAFGPMPCKAEDIIRLGLHLFSQFTNCSISSFLEDYCHIFR
jgi:hypothetical protein